ncbi:MAG: hypothetical protein QM765_01100 [Myxococcales bacterium]
MPRGIRWLERVAAGLALVLAPAAQAPAGEARASGASPESSALASADSQGVERIQGTVASVSEGAGTAELRAGEVFTLRGTPMDLRELRPGAQVSLVYRRYGGVPWLLSGGISGPGSGTGGTGWLDQNLEFKTHVGNVQAVDLAHGTLDLDGHVFHGHPAVLREFEVGERVTVLYQSFSGTDWISPSALGGRWR